MDRSWDKGQNEKELLFYSFENNPDKELIIYYLLHVSSLFQMINPVIKNDSL